MRCHVALLVLVGSGCRPAKQLSEPVSDPLVWTTLPPAPRPIAKVLVRSPRTEPAPKPAPPPRVDPYAAREVALGYPANVRSLRFVKTTDVFGTPAVVEPAQRAGSVREGTRMRPRRAIRGGDGCARRWIELDPRGWVCETMLAPSREEPSTAPTLTLRDDDIRAAYTGVYGTVHRGEVRAYRSAADVQAGAGRTVTVQTSVRAAGVTEVDGVKYWQTTDGELIDASAISVVAPSTWKGVLLDSWQEGPGTPLPVWAHNTDDPYKPVETFVAPRGKKRGTIETNSLVKILETADDGAWARIADSTWIPRSELRIAATAPPPAGIGPDERWIDVDLDEQVLIAYEGRRPVYATLVSTGRRGFETKTGLSRIYAKHEAASMSSDLPGQRYSVADVPWTMFYDGNFALHTSYWHDLFGGPRSHGCVNLAPRDARLLYAWAAPAMPAGWTSVAGDADHPGSLVRVRSRRDPDPELRGYAREIASTD